MLGYITNDQQLAEVQRVLNSSGQMGGVHGPSELHLEGLMGVWQVGGKDLTPGRGSRSCRLRLMMGVLFLGTIRNV